VVFPEVFVEDVSNSVWVLLGSSTHVDEWHLLGWSACILKEFVDADYAKEHVSVNDF
jgi:hypothetical protein